jgi:hypothetical protein
LRKRVQVLLGRFDLASERFDIVITRAIVPRYTVC